MVERYLMSKHTGAKVEQLGRTLPDAQTNRQVQNNCSEQYKCISYLQEVSNDTKKTVIYYYGVKGHGKGLFDAMSGVGLKTPLKKAIVKENSFYDTAENVYEFISEKMKDDDTKI